jgi:hypothetical protein
MGDRERKNEGEKGRERDIDRSTDRQKWRWIDGGKDRQTDRQTDCHNYSLYSHMHSDGVTHTIP